MDFTILNKQRTSLSNLLEKDNVQLWIMFIFGLIAYSFVHVNYNIYYVDDAWVISNVWNITRLGIAEDLVFIEPDESGYAQYFGITYAFIMGHVLNFIGWTKSNVFLINSTLIWSAAIVWYHILKELPFSKRIAKLVLVFLPIFPPFFFAAHCGRPEAFTVLIVAMQLLLFIRKRYFLAALLTGFAFEAHIMGALGLFYLLAYAIYKKEELFFVKEERNKMISHFFFGGVTALGYYFALHGNHFSWAELSGIISQKKDMGTPLNNYILNYFMNYDWYSRVWEFALFLTGIVLYFRKGLFKNNRFLTILLIVLLVSTLITRRENKNYLVYIFPAFMLMYFYTFEQLGKMRLFLKSLVVCMSLYYGLHFYFNNDYDFEKIVLDVNEELKDKDLPIVGAPDFWFASKENKFIPMHHRKKKSLHALDKFYLIQSDYLSDRCKLYNEMMAYYKTNYNVVLVEEVSAFNENNIQIWSCEKIVEPQPLFVRKENKEWGYQSSKSLLEESGYLLRREWKAD